MAFKASLRKILIIMFLLMGIFLTILYLNENQNLLKPASSFFIQNLDIKHNKLKLVGVVAEKLVIPPEKTWTYRCANNKCVREHYLDKTTKRTTFLTCSMLCGPSNIWPEPTIKSMLGTNTHDVSLTDIQIKIKTPFKRAENLMEHAFLIFLNELKQIGQSSEQVRNEEINSNTNNNNNNINNINAVNTVSESHSANDLEKDEKSTKNYYDLPGSRKGYKYRKNNATNVNIYVDILKDPDIHLTLQTDECYNLTVMHQKSLIEVKISANSFFGARHGLSTLQQIIWFDDEDTTFKIINKATIQDCPKFNYRGLMLDTSRHYFSVDTIKRTLIGMSHSKLNRFHWHITDSQSFPFVSKHYPELAKYGAYSSNEIYTHDDIKEIVSFASVRGIQIIPEIDSPAHAGNGWDWGPKKGLGELSLCINQQPWSYYCGEPPCGQLNPKNNNTYLILQKLYQELLELTGPTDFFHMGGDEVNLDCWGQFFNDTDLRVLWCDFMLQAHNRLKLANNGVAPKVTTVWSSGLTSMPCLSKSNWAVQVWGGSTWQENYQLIDSGFNLIISHVDAWYLDCGFGNWRGSGEGACSPYRTWQSIYKHKPWVTMRLNKQQMKQILGGEACLWTEQVDENTVDSRFWPRSGALGERLWTDPVDEHESDNVPKETFNRFSVFRNRLVQLGIKAEPIFPKYCAQNQDECV